MNKELSLEHSIETVRAHLNSLGIKAALVDYDNTLVDGLDIFLIRMRAFSEKIAELSKVERNPDEIMDEMGETIRELRSRLQVNPAIMSNAADRVVIKSGLNPAQLEIQDSHAELMSIYTNHEPQVYRGVRQGLYFMKQVGLERIVGTHGSEEFTRRKIKANQLGNNIDRVYSFNDRLPKDDLAWLRIFDETGYRQDNVIGIGDNWNSDIRPLVKIGVPKNRLFRIKTAYGEANKGKIEGIRELDSFSEVIDILRRMDIS